MKPPIPPDWHLLKLDERQHWREDVQRQTIAIYSVYAYDRNTHVHVCELTPSYALYWIGVDYVEADGLTEEQRDRLNSLIIEGGAESEPGTYMHVYDVDALVQKSPERQRAVGVADEIAEAAEAGVTDEQRVAIDHIIPGLMEGWNTGALQW